MHRQILKMPNNCPLNDFLARLIQLLCYTFLITDFIRYLDKSVGGKQTVCLVQYSLETASGRLSLFLTFYLSDRIYQSQLSFIRLLN